ncbi:MAG TPA: ATP-binding protein [Acidobacteriota bacterium]|nr:ATP-binding protein [Acidobacteriota bacterium]
MTELVLWIIAALLQAAAAVWAWRQAGRADDERPWRTLAAFALILLAGAAAGAWLRPGGWFGGLLALIPPIVLLLFLRRLSESFRGLEDRAEKAERARNQTQRTGRLFQRALTAANWKTLAEEACQATADALHCDYSLLLESDPDGGRLRVRVQTGWKDRLTGMSFDAHQPTAQTMLAQKDPEVIEVPADDEDDQLAAFLNQQNVTSTACVLLDGPQGPIGVLSLHSKGLRLFDADQLEFLGKTGLALYQSRHLRRAQDALKQLKRLRESTAEIVMSFEPAGAITYLNEQGRQVLGVGDLESSDLTLRSVMPDWAYRRYRKEVLEKTASGLWSGETSLVTRRRQEIPVRQVLLGQRDEEGEIAQWTAFSIDLAHNPNVHSDAPSSEELQKQVKALSSQLQEAAGEVEVFAEATGRRLQEPIGAVSSFSRSLLRDSKQLGVGGRRYVQLINEAARSAGTIVLQLNKAARLQRQPFKFTQVDMSALARSVYREISSQYPDMSVRFSMRTLFPVRGDQRQLRRVFSELISNAFKFSQKVEAPEIEVGSQNEEGNYVYYVRDNGVGFEIEKLDRLFGLFQKLHKGSDYPGPGAGLFLVKRIVARHGGEVWAKGALNMGATIYFSLPASTSVDEDPTGEH